MDVDTARRTFPHGTPVRVISGPCAGRTAAVIGIDVEFSEDVDEAVLTIDVGEDFDESVKPDDVEIIAASDPPR